jgi:hypothetical protein
VQPAARAEAGRKLQAPPAAAGGAPADLASGNRARPAAERALVIRREANLAPGAAIGFDRVDLDLGQDPRRAAFDVAAVTEAVVEGRLEGFESTP